MTNANTTPPPFHVIPLLDGNFAVEHLLDFTATGSVDEALGSLCMTIRANSAWKNMTGLRLVARSAPSPLLAVFGAETAGDTRRLVTLRESLEEVLPRHTFVDYKDAETAVEQLANTLISRYGIEEVRSWTFAAIPRGGVVIMGLLAYVLDLHPDQMFIAGSQDIPNNSRTLCIVDDCTLSGIRFRETLHKLRPSDADEYDSKPSQVVDSVVFCPLFAPIELCNSIERSESAIKACICAHPLEDLAPARFADEYPEWYAARSSAFPDAYWIGIPEYVSFAWHEPDSRAWNADTGKIEHGWYLASANRCLSNRLRVRQIGWNGAGDAGALLDTAAERIQGGSGPIRAAEGVVWSSADGDLQLARITSQHGNRPGAIDYFELSGSAISMWYAIIRHGSVDGCVDEILSHYQGDRETVCRDVETLLAELHDFGLLEFHSPHDPKQHNASHSDDQIGDSKDKGNLS